MLRPISLFTAALLLAGAAGADTFAEMFPDHPGYQQPEINAFLERLDYRQGKIALEGGFASIDIPERYYFLPAEDARLVLEELWGNPPDPETLGMIFPVAYTPADRESWGIEVTWEEIGHVSDEDATTIDYDDLLAEMQQDARDENAWRVENGYEEVELVGWAEPPHYDATTRKLYWAKELAFGGEEMHTLNYNIRALGRRGVLQLNFIADMQALAEVDAAVPEILTMVSFEDGHRYADFDASVDTVAAVGIGGLIAGKVLSKAGLLAAALLLLKKFWVVLLLPIFGLRGLFRRES